MSVCKRKREGERPNPEVLLCLEVWKTRRKPGDWKEMDNEVAGN